MNHKPGDISIGLVSISDRAYNGTYPDLGIPALQDWLAHAITSPYWLETRLIPDDREQIEKTLHELVDEDRCSLILTTGGTGPSRRDQTPDATLAVGTRELPDQHAFRADRRTVQTSRRHLRTAGSRIPDPQSSGPPGRHPPDAGRCTRCRRQYHRTRHFHRYPLLHRTHRRPRHRNERSYMQGMASGNQNQLTRFFHLFNRREKQ